MLAKPFLSRVHLEYLIVKVLGVISVCALLEWGFSYGKFTIFQGCVLLGAGLLQLLIWRKKLSSRTSPSWLYLWGVILLASTVNARHEYFLFFGGTLPALVPHPQFLGCNLLCLALIPVFLYYHKDRWWWLGLFSLLLGALWTPLSLGAEILEIFGQGASLSSPPIRRESGLAPLWWLAALLVALFGVPPSRAATSTGWPSWCLRGCFAMIISLGFLSSLESDSPACVEDRVSRVAPSLLALEDTVYFEHSGLDWARLEQVVKQTLFAGEWHRGASTLTMQLAKIRYLSFEKTLLRKAVQILAATFLEITNSKQQLLTQYIDEVSFGAGISGFAAAADYYYKRPLSELTTVEIERLVLTIEDPARYNPAMAVAPPFHRLLALRRNRIAFNKSSQRYLRSCDG